MGESHESGLDPAAQYSRDVTNWITRSAAASILAYNRISLSNENVRLALPYTSQEDPTLTTEMTHAVLYWGRAGHPMARHHIYEAHHFGPFETDADRGQEIRELSRLILGAYIGPLALEQIPQEYRDAAKDFNRASRIDMGILWSKICSQARVPVAIVQTETVTRSAFLLPNAHIANLWCPALMQPGIALRELQDVIKRDERRTWGR